MPSLGTLSVATFRQSAEAVDYSLPGNNLSQTDLVSLRRSIPQAKKVNNVVDPGTLRTTMRFERGFDVAGVSKPVIFNVSGQVPVGVDPALVEAYITDVVLVGAGTAAFKSLSTKGDIQLSD